jgi:hypothetical protein
MKDKKDWRLNNQEKYLKGITLVHRSYCNMQKTLIGIMTIAIFVGKNIL